MALERLNQFLQGLQKRQMDLEAGALLNLCPVISGLLTSLQTGLVFPAPVNQLP